jgi:murein DD-endopeptidase MepM/ murein hydrolase activator NlpD
LKSRKTLSNWLTNRYLLIIRNEENFAEKTTISFNYAKLILISFAFFVVLMLVSLYLSRTLMAQWFDPRHEVFVLSNELIDFRRQVDSLDNQMRMKDQYMQNIQSILRGEVAEINRDSGERVKMPKVSTDEIQNLTPIDSQFRKEFESADLLLTENTNFEYVDLMNDVYFFKPIDGIISRGFDLKIDHYGVDIVSKSNEPVKAVADGTVIFADWTQDFGNVVAIQHRGNMISVYKHNSALLKKVGNFVYSGEVISIIGNTGELTTGPHLHFELWYNGSPLDPEEFISF